MVLQVYGATVKAAAGAIVTIDRNGQAVIHRGLLLREAEGAAHAGTPAPKVSAARMPGTTTKARTGQRGQPKTAAMSDKLAQRLSAHHRKSRYKIEVAGIRKVALAALVHGMVQTVLQEATTATTCRWA